MGLQLLLICCIGSNLNECLFFGPQYIRNHIGAAGTASNILLYHGAMASIILPLAFPPSMMSARRIA